ncbi:MAG: hypothetical protein P4N59_29740 [Negativicutes bacterium]|nr:hypothetical protein [Negativicutes bacterium]
MAEFKVSEATVGEIFGVIRAIDQKLSNLCGKLEEKEKRCSDHNDTTTDHEKRIRTIELWKAGQQGISGVAQRWGPVIISVAVALYIGRGGHP